MSGNLELALETFNRALEYLRSNNLLWEADWQKTRCPAQFSETDFLREAAWVILCTGFREAVVRRSFDYISLSFCDWESASAIVASASACRASALAAMRNTKKMDAILAVAGRVQSLGFARLRRRILKNPIVELQKLPFIGPVTSFHLAKNLGFQVAKPDRHLARMALRLGFNDAQELCESIGRACNETVQVVDIVLWRYAANGLGLQAT
jgi:hypothetical protein